MAGPRAGRPCHAGCRAFTLLELLLATAIAAVVLLVINATFFAALRLHNATHDRIDHDLVLERTLSIMRKDFAGIMVPGNATATTNYLSGQLVTDSSALNVLDGTSERVTPDIYTSSGQLDGWTPYTDVQMVSYYLSPAADGGPTKDLVRLVTRNLLPVTDSTAEAQTLLPGVVSAAIEYYDGQNWLDTWDTTATNTLPTAIKFSLVMAPRETTGVRSDPAPVELLVPVLVKTTTTQQDEAAAAAAGGQ